MVSGNSNLVYTIIRKRTVFHQLANLPTEHNAIARALTKRGKKPLATPSPTDHKEPQTMEGAQPAAEAEPGTLKVSLAATPSKFLFSDELCHEKTNVLVSDQVRHKPGCTATEHG